MGLLDAPSVLFAWVDAGLAAVLSPLPRLVVWGTVAAAASMGLYWALSPQGRIGRGKAELAAARRALDAYDGELSGAWPLMGRLLRCAVRQVGRVSLPVTVASLPVLFLIVWLSHAYALAYPPPGVTPEIRTVPSGLEARWVSPRPTAGGREPPRVRVTRADGRVLDEVALSAPVSAVHKRRWWNVLIDNPAGYLSAGAPLERIEIDLPRRRYVRFGPEWLGAWESVFFTVLVAGSLTIKIVGRIE